MSAQSENLIMVQDLNVELGGRAVLQDVTVSLEAGKLTGLLGPNGAGKTTLIRSILGLIPYRSGTILVDGKTPKEARSMIGYVPQRHEFAWDFPINVEQVVLTGRTARTKWWRQATADDYRAVSHALERVGMSELRERPVGELSGGQRQRILVARALALEPKVLFLDEPYTGLDMPSQEQLTDLFLELAHEDRAVLMSTHDIAGALHTCDSLVLINKTITAAGPLVSLLESDPWVDTFNIRENNPLLQVVASAKERQVAAGAISH